MDIEDFKTKESKTKNIVVNIAIFMIYLIITLPLYSSSVMAASIDDVQVYGKAKIPGYRAKSEETVINVTVTSPEDPLLSPNQVRILEDPTATFACKQVDNSTKTSECIYKYSESPMPSGYGMIPFRVQLYNDANMPMSSPYQASVMVDSAPPEVVSLNLKAHTTGMVTASYVIKDSACSSVTCAGKCSGISALKVMSASLDLASNNSFGDGCQHAGSLNLTGLAVANQFEKKRICLDITDKLGQTGKKCRDVWLDTRKPILSGYTLLDSQGNIVSYTNGKPQMNAKLRFNITEDSSLVGDVLVNISDISEQAIHKSSFTNMKAKLVKTTIVKKQNISTYEVTGLYIILTTDRSVSFTVSAMDSWNNKMVETKSLSLKLDSTPPSSSKFYSDYLDSAGDYWVKEENNSIYLDITESGSGFLKQMVFLDFSSFDSSLKLVHPNECKSGWTCIWRYIPVDRSSGTKLFLTPQHGSSDDAGNALKATTGVFRVDVDDPIIVGVNISSVGTGHDPWNNTVVGGDVLDIKVFIKDHSEIKTASANFSDLLVKGGNILGNCSKTTEIVDATLNTYVCTWVTTAVKPGYSEADIDFEFFDLVGNNATHEEKIEILGRENETIKTWDVEVDDWSPKAGLDRQTYRLASQSMFFQIKWKSIRDAEIVSVKFDPTSDCFPIDYVNADTSNSQASIYLLDFPDYASSENENTIDDVVQIDFDPDSVPEVSETDGDNETTPLESVTINCSFRVRSIVSLSGKDKLTEDELVNISFVTPIYNNPLGQNIGNIKDKIDEMVDEVDHWEWITIVRKIFQYAEQICNFITLLIQIEAAFSVAKDIVGGKCATCTAAAPTVIGAACASASCSTSTVMGEIVNKQDDFLGGITSTFYHYCGLFISCRVTKVPKKQCPQTDKGWCKVQKFWADANGWWANVANGWVNKASQAGGFNMVNTGEGATGVFDGNSFDPKKSFISSLMSLCLPGIIYNLEKLRQIQCKKILCYKIDVASGRPVWKCDQEHSYLICTYFMGQVFAAIPIMQYVSDAGQIIADIFKNPFQLIGLVIDKGCNLICSSSHTVGCSVCRGVQWASTMSNIVSDLVEGTGSRFEAAGFDFCEEALKDEPDYTNIAPPVPPSGVGAGNPTTPR